MPSDAPPPSSSAAFSSDETLLSHYREGDEKAFAELYRRHRTGLYRFIRSLCSAPSPAAAADEIFQETWLALIRSNAVPDGRAHFKTWLYQMARHRLIDHWRKHKGELMNGETFDSPNTRNAHNTLNKKEMEKENSLHARPEAIDATPETRVLRAEQLQHIADALETLPLPQREVFLLRAHAEMEISEIATLTETPLEAVKSRYRYALAKLRQRLTPSRETTETEVKTAR